MFGNNVHWWLGLIALLLFVGCNVLVYALRNRPRLCYVLAWCIGAFFLIYKCAEYAYHQCVGEHLDIPVEFSALSYIAIAVMMVWGIKRGQAFAAFVALLAGLMYSVSMWVSPDSHVANATPYFLVMAIINHHLLYTAGLLLIANCRQFAVKDCWIQVVGVGVFVGYSWLMCSVTPYIQVMGKPIIIQITDGTILSNFLGIGKIQGGWYALYYVVAIIILAVLLVGMYAFNHYQCKRRARLGLVVDGYGVGWQIFQLQPEDLQPVLLPKKAQKESK